VETDSDQKSRWLEFMDGSARERPLQGINLLQAMELVDEDVKRCGGSWSAKMTMARLI
jgi:hypothetical protein